MPQEFQIIRCFCCEKFQVQQTKKAKKWQCKVCGEKQSLKKIYFMGSAPECRIRVQQMNFVTGQRKDNMLIQESFEEDWLPESNNCQEGNEISYADEFQDSTYCSVGKLNSNPDNDEEMPQKKQRVEFHQTHQIECKSSRVFKVCKDTQDTWKENSPVIRSQASSQKEAPEIWYQNTDILTFVEETLKKNSTMPEHSTSVILNVSFDNHSPNKSPQNESLFQNINTIASVEEPEKKNNLILPGPSAKRGLALKNKGFQFIKNAAKKLG